MEIRLLRLPEVRNATGFSRSEIYRLIALKRFPAPVPLGERAVAWNSSAISDWIQDRIRAGKKPAPERKRIAA